MPKIQHFYSMSKNDISLISLFFLFIFLSGYLLQCLDIIFSTFFLLFSRMSAGVSRLNSVNTFNTLTGNPRRLCGRKTWGCSCSPALDNENPMTSTLRSLPLLDHFNHNREPFVLLIQEFVLMIAAIWE